MIGFGAALAAAVAAPVTIGDLIAVTDLSSLSVSPDGQTLAFRTEQMSLVSDQVLTRWWLVATDGSAPARFLAEAGPASVTGAGAVAPDRAIWSREGDALLFRVARDGAVQVWRAELATGRLQQVTRAEGDVEAFALTPDDRAVVATLGPPRAAVEKEERDLRSQGARVDMTVDLSVGVIGGAPGRWRPQTTRVTGDWYDRRPLLAGGKGFVRQPLDGGAAETVASGPDWPEIAGPDPDLAEAICRVQDCDTARPHWTLKRADGSVLVGLIDRGANQSLAIWTPGKLRRVRRSLGVLAGSRSLFDACAASGPFAFCVEARADLPPRLVRITLSSGELRVLYAPNAELARRTAGWARPWTGKDGQGHAFAGQLFLPKGPRPAGGYPLVVQYYLCEGFLRGGQGDELPFLPLAAKGVASLCINGHVDRSGRRDRLGDYRVAQAGIEAAIASLSATGVVDARRVGMQGLSFGSEVTMWMVRRSKALRAAAIASGQLEPNGYWFHAAPGARFADVQKRIWGVGQPDADLPQWREVSPARDSDQVQIPLLMQVPESEARWSIELIGRLREARRPLEVFAFPDAAHLKSAPRQKAAAYERNLAWFSFWLAGIVPSDSADLGRGARWRALLERVEP